MWWFSYIFRRRKQLSCSPILSFPSGQGSCGAEMATAEPSWAREAAVGLPKVKDHVNPRSTYGGPSGSTQIYTCG